MARVEDIVSAISRMASSLQSAPLTSPPSSDVDTSPLNKTMPLFGASLHSANLTSSQPQSSDVGTSAFSKTLPISGTSRRSPSLIPSGDVNDPLNNILSLKSTSPQLPRTQSPVTSQLLSDVAMTSLNSTMPHVMASTKNAVTSLPPLSTSPLTSSGHVLSSRKRVLSPDVVLSQALASSQAALSNGRPLLSTSRRVLSPDVASYQSNQMTSPENRHMVKSRSMDSLFDIEKESAATDRKSSLDKLQRKLSSTFKKHYLKTVVVTDNNSKQQQKVDNGETSVLPSEKDFEWKKLEKLKLGEKDYDTRKVKSTDSPQNTVNSSKVVPRDINSNIDKVNANKVNDTSRTFHQVHNEKLNPSQRENKFEHNTIQTVQKKQQTESKRIIFNPVKKISKFMNLLGTFKGSVLISLSTLC